MKKALILTTTSGFLSQFELNNVRLLQERGYQVHYATNFGVPVYEVKDETLKKMGIVLHHISIEKSPFSLKKNFWAFRELKRIIDREQIDVVHCHNPVGGLLGRLSAKYSKRKPTVIYTAHGLHFFDGAPLKNWLFYYPVEKHLARYTDILVTINHEDYARAGTFTMKKGGQVRLIPGVGVDTQTYRPDRSGGNSLRAELGIPENAIHIVSAGELTQNKNQRIVIEALAALGRDDIYYSICGEGPNRSSLERLIREKGLQDRVFLRGYWYDMPRMYSSADISVFPSYREGMGMAALEAMAMGIPMIASDNRGTREYMADMVNGMVCRPDSSEDFASAILTLCEDQNIRKQFSAKGVETVKNFTLERTEVAMNAIYDILPRGEQVEERSGMAGNPAVSVIMGVYDQNDLAALEKSVRSVLDQTFRDFEFLIYNDGSNRKVTEYIRSLANWDNRIRIIESETNHGLGYALNRCIEAARGRYLARMDADDVSHENRFQVEVEFLEQHPEYMWCGSNCEIFDSIGVWGEGTRPETPQADDYLKYSPFIHPTVMYRAELFDRVAGYAEDRITLRCEDYELFMRLFTMGYKGYNIQQALLGYFINRKKYHSRPLRYSLYESRVRREGFVRMGLMWPKGWLYVFRPIVGGLLPAGVVERYKERIAEL